MATQSTLSVAALQEVITPEPVASERFYERLDSFSDFFEFSQLDNYRPLPSDWCIVITDIADSTRAIDAGRYKDVNSVSTASIVAVLNAVAPLAVPYVFGGDGATLCVPAARRAAVESALVAARNLAAKEFGLTLRVGIVPMSALEAERRTLLIAKYRPTPNFQQAMFQGDGLAYAESLVKAQADGGGFDLHVDAVEAHGDFGGFECRWQEVRSPHEETVAILVQAVAATVPVRQRIYAEVAREIFRIYGDERRHHPVRAEKLVLEWSLRRLQQEIRIRASAAGWLGRLKYAANLVWLLAAGRYLMAHNVRTRDTDWGGYRHRLVANTDYRKCDETLRMVLSGSTVQRRELLGYLTRLRLDGRIAFGVHASPGALLTCLIFDYGTDHVHFLDGSHGGYAMAAKELKAQLKG